MKQSKIKIPRLIYATAMKRNKTTDIVTMAIKSGYRSIDTANQLLFNDQHGVGEALQKSEIPRNQFFIQTKFASPMRHFQIKVPYDSNLKLQDQARQSFQMSLKNLKTDYIDSLLLYGALKSMPRFLTVWKIFEEFVRKEKVRYIGVANFYHLPHLKILYKEATIKPKFIQNRFTRSIGYDKQIRKFCNQNNIIYQSFQNLSSNPHILQSKQMESLKKKYNKTAAQILYRAQTQMSFIPLTGTISPQHMKENLSIFQFELTKQDVKSISKFFQ